MSQAPSAPSKQPLMEAAYRKLAFAVPLVVTMLRTSPTGQWRDDLPVVRALGLVPSGTEGFVSTALTQLLALLPLIGAAVALALPTAAASQRNVAAARAAAVSEP